MEEHPPLSQSSPIEIGVANVQEQTLFMEGMITESLPSSSGHGDYMQAADDTTAGDMDLDDLQDHESLSASSTEHTYGTEDQRPSDQIPIEELKVMRWGPKVVKHICHPTAKAWLRRSGCSENHGINAIIRTSPDYLDYLKSQYASAFHACPHAAVTYGRSFIWGQPLLDPTVTIRTCVGSERPAKLYRAIHDGMPYDGTSARGLEVTSINALFFQRYLQNHLVWICREKSPFLSMTSARETAVVFASVYAEKKRTGIKILEVDTNGEYWDHNISRLWEVKHLLQSFRMLRKGYHLNEYLVENVIPPEHITKTYVWDNQRDRDFLDPSERIQNICRQQQLTNAVIFEHLKEVAAWKRQQRREKPHDHEEEVYVPRTNKFKAFIAHARKGMAVPTE